MPKQQMYIDPIHGITAVANSKTGAWQLIRNKCYEMNLEVPTFEQIKKFEDRYIKK